MWIISTVRGNLSALLDVLDMKGKEGKHHPGWKGLWKMSVEHRTQGRVASHCSRFYLDGSEKLRDGGSTTVSRKQLPMPDGSNVANVSPYIEPDPLLFPLIASCSLVLHQSVFSATSP